MVDTLEARSKIQDLNNNTKKCLYAFNHTEYNNNGDWRVCCRTIPLANKSKYPSITEFWNGEEMRSIRKAMLDGKEHPHCNFCYSKENEGKTSFRQQSNFYLMYDTKSIENLENSMSNTDQDGYLDLSNFKSFEIRISNLCNLKCRMCNPYYSSRWAKDWKEYREYGKSIEDHHAHTDWDELLKHPLSQASPKEIKRIFKDIAPSLERLSITGGEPFMEPQLYDIFDIIEPYAKNISIIFVSNGTQIRNIDQLGQRLNKFRKAKIVLSVDGHGEYYEYVRQLSDWRLFSETAYKIRDITNDTIDIQFKPLVQIYNYPSIIDTLTWVNDNFDCYIDMTLLEYPNHMSMYCLPIELKNKIHKEWTEWTDLVADDLGPFSTRWTKTQRNRIVFNMRRILNSLTLRNTQDLLPKFIGASDLLDSIQKVKKTWRELLPELAKELDNIKQIILK